MNRLPEFSWPPVDSNVADVLHQMALDGSWGRYHGPHSERLIDSLRSVHQVDHVSLCSSGTSAVELALRAAGVSEGDEVVLSAYDYKANFSNIVLLKAKPVLVDVADGQLSPSVERFAEAISDKTRAIIMSHLHGWLAPVAALCDAAAQRGVLVIEDACQVPGASIEGRMAGSTGDLGVLSFGGSKLLTAGRGGAVLTDDAKLAQRIHLYTQRGNDAYPLSEMQSAVLYPQLNTLSERNVHRATSVQKLCDGWPEGCFLQPVLQSEFASTAFFKLPFLMTDDRVDRSEVIETMQQLGVPVAEAFPALHKIHAKSRFRMVGLLKNAERLHSHLMTLHHPILLQDDTVIESLRERLIGFTNQA